MIRQLDMAKSGGDIYPLQALGFLRLFSSHFEVAGNPTTTTTVQITYSSVHLTFPQRKVVYKGNREQNLSDIYMITVCQPETFLPSTYSTSNP